MPQRNGREWESTMQILTFIAFIYQPCWIKTGLLVVLYGSGVVTTPPPLCVVDDFDSQVRHLLESEMLTQAEIANLSTVFHDLQDTLQILWPDSEVVPLGSFVTGLASKSSDADCMVKVSNRDGTSDRHLILQAAQLLQRYPHLYDQVRTKVDVNRRMPLLKFKYVPTKRNCDVNFISNLGLQNSHMMGYYLNIEDKFLTLAAILKVWSKVHQLRSTDTLTSNSLNLLIIFYLQQENLVPPFALLQKHLARCPTNDWETSFKTIDYNSTTTSSLYQLLGHFFKYYSKFNFDQYVVSPLLGYPISKTAFENIDSLPEELSLYKNYMRKLNSKPLTIKTKLCVQDAIEQRRNTADVPDSKAKKLLSHIRFAARMFDILPKNLFLKVILDKDSPRFHFSKILNEQNRLSERIRLKFCHDNKTFV